MKKLLMLFLLLTLSVGIAFAQSPIKIGANVGGAFPAGTFADVYKGGVSAELVILYTLPVEGLDLSLTAGYSGLQYKYEYFTDEVNTKLNVGVRNPDPEWTASSIPIMLGLRYTIPAGGFNPYLTGELGVQMMSFSDRIAPTRIIGNSSDPTTLDIDNAIESKSETGFGFSVGAGAEIPVAKKISIDLGFKYGYGGIVYSNAYEVFRNNNSQYTAEELKNTGLLSARLGVIIGF
ncbi:MAG: outer membrane beta-barrel protein [Ignavibacteria bacterium]|nr:outer membrane beta-barrel protein [Ignavibacteria bacterium]